MAGGEVAEPLLARGQLMLTSRPWGKLVPMAGTDNLEWAIDELYVAPPEDFTESRNSLAKRLKDGGEERAAQVRVLRKPVRAAWAVNQLVSQDRAAVKELIAAGGRLRTAQRRAMSTKGAEVLREGSVERARLV